MTRWFRKLYNPPVFQGSLDKQKYFEGWYYKFVSPDGKRFAFIPGVSLNKNDSHSFIQFIHGDTGKTEYFRFPVGSFRYEPDRLFVNIEGNHFSDTYMQVDLENGNFSAKGRVEFSRTVKLPSKLLSPGIMGWYSFMPFMECYHGLVSLDHELRGEIVFKDEKVSLAGGRGYIEKDWGTSFPRSWIWMQSNNFGEDRISFMFSLAKIPWLGSEFDGFLCVFLLGGEIHRFATYTGAKVTQVRVEGTHIMAEVQDKRYRLVIRMEKEKAGSLAAPIFGEMKRTIHESLNSRVHLEFYHQDHMVFSGTGEHAGCEIVGDETWFV